MAGKDDVMGEGKYEKITSNLQLRNLNKPIDEADMTKLK